MTREDIIRMAREAGICTWEVVPEHEARKLEHFAGSVCILNAELKSVVEELRSSLIELLKEYHPTERWTEKQSERGGAMTKEDIVRMAREAGLAQVMRHSDFTPWDANTVQIERFAALVAAAEREAAALVCDEASEYGEGAWLVANRIRARGGIE